MGGSGVDKFELQVSPNSGNNYRGGTSLQDLKQNMQNLQYQQVQMNSQAIHPNPLFCGFGNNMSDQNRSAGGPKPLHPQKMNVGEILSCGTMMRNQQASNQPE